MQDDFREIVLRSFEERKRGGKVFLTYSLGNTKLKSVENICLTSNFLWTFLFCMPEINI